MSQPITGTLQVRRKREQLLKAAGDVALLPSTLVAPMRVLQMHRRDETELARYGEVLAADPSMAAKVLGLVNSAAFAPPQPVTKVSAALEMIGLKNLLPLVFGVSLGGIFNKLALPAEERGALWRASLLKAITAHEYVRGQSPGIAEEAFTAALVQDVALPLIYAGDRAAWLESAAIVDIADPGVAAARERALYGTDHAEVGAAIAKSLGLPKLYQEAIALHHMPERLLKCGKPAFGRAMVAAAALPHRLVPNGPALRGRLLAAIGNAYEPEELARRILDRYARTLEQLGDADERSVAFKEFMQALCMEVALCMEGAIGESTASIKGLKDRGAELERRMEELKQEVIKAEYDPLTGVLNRRGFMRRAERFVSLAGEYAARCALGFADIDDFKQLNDRHGHDVGDRSLVALAKALTASLGGRGLVGRMGGDEFCFVLIAKDETGLSEVARRIESAFCQLRVEVAGGETAAVTSSVGLVPLERAGSEADLEQVLKNADQLMYGAKRSGKGRCVAAIGRGE